MKTRLKNGVALALLPQIIVVKWFGSHPELVEKYYSEAIYPTISELLRLLFGWIPFSFGDLLYLGLVILVLRYLYFNWRSVKKNLLFFLRDVLVALSITYFLFHLLWGMNYYRIPIGEKLALESVEYSAIELKQFCSELVEDTNTTHMGITKDSLAAIAIPYSKKEIYAKTFEGYKKAQTQFKVFDYKRKSIKHSLFSLPLTYMGYAGYLNPFTNEAQVNAKIPKVRFPTISAHEIAHQIGYSSEGETNLIAFMVSGANTDPYFQYAAKTHALAYCLSDLRARDSLAVEGLIAQLNPGVMKNYREISEFWERYQNPAEPVFKSMFSTFLKANNQKDGILSYNQVVGLLMAYDKKYGF